MNIAKMITALWLWGL